MGLIREPASSSPAADGTCRCTETSAEDTGLSRATTVPAASSAGSVQVSPNCLTPKSASYAHSELPTAGAKQTTVGKGYDSVCAIGRIPTNAN